MTSLPHSVVVCLFRLLFTCGMAIHPIQPRLHSQSFSCPVPRPPHFSARQPGPSLLLLPAVCAKACAGDVARVNLTGAFGGV